jgi:hypothetical protein
LLQNLFIFSDLYFDFAFPNYWIFENSINAKDWIHIAGQTTKIDSKGLFQMKVATPFGISDLFLKKSLFIKI